MLNIIALFSKVGFKIFMENISSVFQVYWNISKWFPAHFVIYDTHLEAITNNSGKIYSYWEKIILACCMEPHHRMYQLKLKLTFVIQLDRSQLFQLSRWNIRRSETEKRFR